MKRLLPATATVLFAVALFGGARPAHAQATGTAGTSGAGATTFGEADFFIAIQESVGTNLGTYDLPRFFNKARCDCNQKVFVYVSLTPTGFAKRAVAPMGTFSVLVGGSGCESTIGGTRASCKTLISMPITNFMASGRNTVETDARVMSTTTSAATNPDGTVVGGGVFTPTTDCTSPTNGFNQNVWILLDTGGDGSAETVVKKPVFIDLTPPPAPAVALDGVRPGNEAVTISWTLLDFAANQDLAGYQVLCRRANLPEPVFSAGTFAEYVKSCQDKRVGTGPEGLDPTFACSPLLSRSTSSYRVKILQNGIVYGTTVVAVDNSGNASTPDVHEAIPTKTTSFYDYYRNGNETNGGAGQPETPGEAAGGFCAVGGGARGGETTDARPLASVTLASAAAVALALRARRRRRR